MVEVRPVGSVVKITCGSLIITIFNKVKDARVVLVKPAKLAMIIEMWQRLGT